jgi:two-component system, OmpR family, sensor kinase
MTRARALLGRVTGRIRQASAATPLRVKLMAALLVLVSLALVGTGVAGAYALRGYLMDKVDSQLAATGTGGTWPAELGCVKSVSGTTDPDTGRPAESSAFYTERVDSDGYKCVGMAASKSGQTAPALPKLDDAERERRGGEPFTVRASGGGHAWRVLLLPVEEQNHVVGTMAVAFSLDDVDDTVGQLILIEMVVGGVVLFVLGALGYTAIRSSLRPLVEVETTAAAIASGDLTRRIPRWPAKTEVGRLAGALNGMLAQIETAFTERQEAAARAGASEARMRRFIADASHELRTPLTAVRGFAELLRQQSTGREEPGSNVLVATDRIEQAATRMGLLIEDLLLLARLDQQRPLEASPVDLLALVTDAVGEARIADPEHPVTVVVPSGEDDDPPVVRGDLAKLRQVVGNLLGNAFQHTPPGTAVTVTVGTEAGNAVLEVADEGPGLRPEDAARIFERFYRVDAARNRASGGTGLGLSIVDSIVTAHGGSVTLRSAPGEGACFRVTLPLLEAEAAAAPSAGAPQTVSPAANGPRS